MKRKIFQIAEEDDKKLKDAAWKSRMYESEYIRKAIREKMERDSRK